MCVWLVLNQIHSLDKCPFVRDARHCPSNEDSAMSRGQSSLALGGRTPDQGAHNILGSTAYVSGSGPQGDDDRT